MDLQEIGVDSGLDYLISLSHRLLSSCKHKTTVLSEFPQFTVSQAQDLGSGIKLKCYVQTVQTLEGHDDDVNAVAFMDDSCNIIASGSDDHAIRVPHTNPLQLSHSTKSM